MLYTEAQLCNICNLIVKNVGFRCFSSVTCNILCVVQIRWVESRARTERKERIRLVKAGSRPISPKSPSSVPSTKDKQPQAVRHAKSWMLINLSVCCRSPPKGPSSLKLHFLRWDCMQSSRNAGQPTLGKVDVAHPVASTVQRLSSDGEMSRV